DNLMLEPQLQYTWQGLSLDDGQDNAGYVKFGHGSAQHVRAGFRLGSHNDMSFGEGTSSRDTLRDSAKHRVRELPVNWWVQPSVIRTFSSRGDMSMGTAAAGSNMTFSPSRNGTSLDLQAGLEARVRENITLGVQAGYAHSVSGSSAEGYNGQATLQAGLEARVRENITLGVQAGYAHSVSGSSAEGYNGQATLNVTF
ncbi:autotransporter domain-containing protein, partial [Escherichia coli]|uniref:autotransporter domain-containing protein n=1 Tax=Escherichia coli TaxID=562 RepID=UPI003D9DB288